MHGRFGLGRFVLLFVKVELNKKLVENGRTRRRENWRPKTNRKLEFSLKTRLEKYARQFGGRTKYIYIYIYIYTYIYMMNIYIYIYI